MDGGAGTSGGVPPSDERTEPTPAFPKAPAAEPDPVTAMEDDAADVEALEDAAVGVAADGTPEGMAAPAGIATPLPTPMEGEGDAAVFCALPPLACTLLPVPFFSGADGGATAAVPLPCRADVGAVSAGLTETGFSAGALAACAASLFLPAWLAVAPPCFADRDDAWGQGRAGAFGSTTMLCGAVLPPRLPLPADFPSGCPWGLDMSSGTAAGSAKAAPTMRICLGCVRVFQ